MGALPLNPPLWRGCWFGLILVFASALPAWSDQSMVPSTGTKQGWTSGQAGPPMVDQGFLVATPSHRSVPSWSLVPSAHETTPSWLRLQNGAGLAPGWSPPSPPVITNSPLWQGI